MQLINPIALLLLGLIPILILIHSLKPKPRQIEVTNLFLWQEALSKKKGGVRIQSFIKNLPLFFQILAVTLASVALAKPMWTYTTQIKGNVILVLDSSASMKTRTKSGIRFDQAKKEALRLVDELSAESRMLIIEASRKPILRSALSQDKAHLREVIEGIQPTDVPGRLDKALYLALSFMDPQQDDWTYIISDGAGTDFEKLTRTHKRIKPILISGGTRNIGITKFEFRPELDNEDRYEILLEVKNFNRHPVLCPIHVTLGEKRIVKNTFGLRAFEKKLLIFPYSGVITGTAQATIGLDDDFPIDNNAYNVMSASKEIWILLVTKGNFFLEKLLEAYPNFMINSVKEIIPSSWREQTQRHHIVILDRISPPFTDRGNFLLINSFSPSIPIAEVGKIDDIEVLDWDRKNPLMANLDLSGLHIEAATLVNVDKDLKPLLESHRHGLMYAYEKQDLRAVFLGFDLTRSDLPLRVAFPVMMSNIVQWLHPHRLRFTSLKTKAGEPFDIHLESQTRNFSIRTPSGKVERLSSESNPFTYVDTGTVGVYTVIEKEKWRNFAVNLTDESESDIHAPPHGSALQKRTVTAEPEPTSAQLPLWILFFLTASFIFVLEWYVWLKGR